jgi:hypothetical protein
MAIERPLATPTVAALPEVEDLVDVQIPMDLSPVDEAFEITELDDGGALVAFGPEEVQPSDIPFDANLAEYMDDADLTSLARELIGFFDSDLGDRRDWEELQEAGLDLLGLKIEERTKPWKGACGITHPMFAEAVVRFQSQQIGEMFPAAGPCRVKLVGKQTEELARQGIRVKDFMNYQLTEVMEDYREECDKLLFTLPVAGSAFKKTYYDPILERPVSEFVPPEDFVVGAGTKTLKTCKRFAHVNHVAPNDIRKMQAHGFYRRVELHDAEPEKSGIEEKKEELSGVTYSYEGGELVTLLEFHTEIDLDGFNDYAEGDSSLPEAADGEVTGIALPYVVTVDKDRGEVLAIRRNWLENDTKKERRDHFTHYQYIPGVGFYGLGLAHLIGGIAKGATSLTRQLIDAGTLANLPGGYKASGLRIKGDSTPIAAGEWRDVHVPGGKIADNLFPLPYGEPSTVLAALLESIVEEGRRFASLTDVNISSMNNEAPVGTTLALLERNMKVMSAISARIHGASRGEHRQLSAIFRDWYQDGLDEFGGYPYDTGDADADFRGDFDGRVDVLPVTDPNSSTMAQRIMTMQTALQLAERYPGGYPGMDVLHRKMLTVLEIQDIDDILPTKETIKLMDPVTENMNLMNGLPVKAFQGQDHQAHISAHMAAAQDPKMMELLQNNPAAGGIQAAGMAHVTEHLAFQYRNEIERSLGVTLPPMGEELPPEIEAQLSGLIARASSDLFQRHQAEQAAVELTAKIEDPILQDTRENTAIKRLQAETQAKKVENETQMDVVKIVDNHELKVAELQNRREISAEQIRADLIGEMMEAASRTEVNDTNKRIAIADFILKAIEREDNVTRDALQERVKTGDANMKLLVDLMNGRADREAQEEALEKLNGGSGLDTGEAG